HTAEGPISSRGTQMLETLTSGSFAGRIGETFRIHTGEATSLEAVLSEVTERSAPAGFARSDRRVGARPLGGRGEHRSLDRATQRTTDTVLRVPDRHRRVLLLDHRRESRSRIL